MKITKLILFSVLCSTLVASQLYSADNSYQKIALVFTEDFGGPAPGFRYKVKDVSINNKSNDIVLGKGGQVTVEMKILHDCTSCGNAVNQVIVGLSSDKKAQISVWNGKQRSGGPVMVVNKGSKVQALAHDNPGKAKWVTVKFEIKVPKKSGTYYLRSRYSQAYTGNLLVKEAEKLQQPFMTEPLNWWRVDRPDGPGAEANIARIQVKK